jgi:hypothetical protein
VSEDAHNHWTALAETLTEKLVHFPGPAYRKAYLANLMASGSRLSGAGDIRAGEYCFAKVAEALKDYADIEPSVGTNKMPSPLEILRHHWRKERLVDAEVVLRRQGSRLSSLENQIYREKLEKLRSAGEKAATKSQAAKVDSSLLDLRLQLYRRVLKSQKVSILRKQSASLSLRHNLLLPSSPPVNASTAMPIAVSPKTNIKANAKPKVEASNANPLGSGTIIGPYNDRYNLGDLLTLVSQADAAWVEEFLDLYRDLRDLKGMVQALPIPAR